MHHGINGGTLVRGFFKAKASGKTLIFCAVQAEGVSGTGGAAGVDAQQLGSGVAHLACGAAARFFPLAAAETVQRCFVAGDAGVAAN